MFQHGFMRHSVLIGLVWVWYSQTVWAQLDPTRALASMKAGDGLQVELFAAEPMLINPTAIDVDHLGRVWVVEAVNYRRINFKRPILREAGDRIQVLVDEKGTGSATKAITFYQGKELYGPLSVCVIPNPNGKGQRVLVAQSPDILEFTDADGDCVADGPPKKFLTGFGGFDHDHGVHGLHVGPEGKLYFTVGDSGLTGLQSSDGKGKKWVSNSSDLQKGTVWRCDLDGKNLELIAHNFRNNYEACVDSFGEIWLSDNDDDGNQQTRICFVLPGGNYGYGPRGPGQSHWHEEQPGIVHKILRTGFGSPTGIQFYEGNFLPPQYANTLLHCDAGPREVRAFTRKIKGAAYELEKNVILTSSDTWFRPSDVCTGPDGSIFVADWYDPGVGGHGMGDWTRGRIYRITPKDHKGYKVPALNLESNEGLAAALASANMTTRLTASLAIDALAVEKRLKFLSDLFKSTKDPRLQARIMYRVYQVEKTEDLFEHFAKSVGGLSTIVDLQAKNPQFNVAVNEALLQRSQRWGTEFSPNDYAQTPATKRDVLLHLRSIEAKRVKPIFYQYARAYAEGKISATEDIFFRAALNIACGTEPNRRNEILADFEKYFPEWNDRVAELVWELQPPSMLGKMEKLLSDPKITSSQKGHIVDIIAAGNSLDSGKTMLSLLKSDAPAEVKSQALANLKLFLPTKWNALVKSGEIDPLVKDLLKNEATQAGALNLIATLNANKYVSEVAKLAESSKNSQVQAEAYRTLASLGGGESLAALKKGLAQAPTKQATAQLIEAFGVALNRKGITEPETKTILEVLSPILLSAQPDPDILRIALESMVGSRVGTQWLLTQKEKGALPEKITGDVGRLVRNTPYQDLRNKALLLFPTPGKLDPKKLPPVTELAKRIGNSKRGEEILKASLKSELQCLRCHMIQGTGGNIGPDLSMIGKKGSKENLLESILVPSKAIADQYVQWTITTLDGKSITGLLVAESEKKLTLRDANGKDYEIESANIDSKKKSLLSIMPDNLINAMTEDDLIDLVEYMTTLKTASHTPEMWHILGPFANDEKDSALDQDLGLEKLSQINLSEKLKGKSGEVKWSTIKTTSSGYVDLQAHYQQAGINSASYLYQKIDSSEAQEAVILFGNDDGARIWLNGKEIFVNRDHFAAAPARHKVNVKLNKGPNTILIKIVNGNNPHGMYFTINAENEMKPAK